MDEIKNNLEGYLSFLAGDDSKFTQAEWDSIRAVVFSDEANEIQKIAATELGAGA